jgi:exopolysaccharide biosynthesis polyprenyl glycosylphosphotransferase
VSIAVRREPASRAVAVRGAAEVVRRPRADRILRAVFWTDLVVLVAAFVGAFLLRFPGDAATGHSAYWVASVIAAPVVVVLWMVLLTAFRTRDARIIGVGDDEYRRLLLASLVTGAVMSVVAFSGDFPVPRGFVAIAFPAALVLLVLGRKVWRTVLVRSRSRGGDLAEVLLVGELDDVRYVGRRIELTPGAGYRVHGVVTDCAPSEVPVDLGGRAVPVLGGIDEVLAVAHRTGVTAVVFTGTVSGGHERLRRLGWQLEADGIELVVSSPLVDVSASRVHHRPVDGLPLMHVDRPEYTRRPGKRMLDVVGAAIGLVLLSPVLAVIGLAIRLDDRGPVLFSQQRVGRGGEHFPIRKFRTMCVDAEARMADLAAHNEGAGPLFKLQHDPRVTRVGAFLRKTSLDELPQLWNVLVGQMSLVGPRPALPREVAVYEDFADRRLLVTPGITGLWQISGRSDLDWADGVRLDLHYVENWSFVHDVVILGRTIPSVLRSRGAY